MTAFSRHGDYGREDRDDNRKQFVAWSRKSLSNIPYKVRSE